MMFGIYISYGNDDKPIINDKKHHKCRKYGSTKPKVKPRRKRIKTYGKNK